MKLINLMTKKHNKEILINTVLYSRHIYQLKSVMIDCKINNVSKDTVNILDRHKF